MSFRGRLIAFFVLIVVIPTAAIAVLVLDVTSDSREGKADAQLSTGLETALSIYEDDVATAKRAGATLARDPTFQEILQTGDPGDIEATAAGQAGVLGIEYLNVELPGGKSVEVVPADDPLAIAFVGVGGFELQVSTTNATDYVQEVSETTGLDVAVVGEDGISASTIEPGSEELPQEGESDSVESSDTTLRAAAGSLPDTGGDRVVLFTEVEEGGFFGSSPGIAVGLLGFLLIAVAFIFLVVRTLQGQIESMLAAARRIGGGDFTGKVPVVGNDEMAGLADEFNKMSDQLAAQMDQLRHQRDELNRSVERLGEAFEAGLDRKALLAILIDTAVSTCNAELGRMHLLDDTTVEEPAGSRGGSARDAAIAAETRSARDGAQVEARREDGYALAAPLRQLGSDGEQVGTMSIARRGKEFNSEERSVFLYLVGQASASLENISTHERVSEQAVTDELTGLANNRAFRETIEREAARAERFGHDLSLLLLDIDDFKLVNDTHGHPQGDEVLRVIGSILNEQSRGVDEPARYGGEEFVVALPETDLQGALEVAERIRARIEEEPIEMLDGSKPMYVSASFGAATLPGSAENIRELIEAADKALYEAKRAGKNRVVASSAKSASGSRR